MAGVIVQSKATSHVYRIFSALVVLLLLMAFAIGMSRLRSDQQGSPYGALTALAPVAPQDPVPAAALTAVIHAKTAASPAADVPPSTSAPAAITAVAAPPQTSLSPTPTASVVPANMLALADPGKGPRKIALDKAAAGAAIPQPAPAAVVTAAAKSMTAPPAVPSAAPATLSTAAIASPAPAMAQAPAATASPAPATMAPAPAAMTPPPAAVTPPPTAKAPPPARKVAAVEDGFGAPEKPHSNAGRVNINHASVDEMNHLGAGHIGAAIARGRPYRSIEDLVSRRVLKARDLARIEAAITAY